MSKIVPQNVELSIKRRIDRPALVITFISVQNKISPHICRGRREVIHLFGRESIEGLKVLTKGQREAVNKSPVLCIH